MVQEGLNAEPKGASGEVEAIHPDRPLRRIQFVHSPHVPIDHAPRYGIVLGSGAIVDLGLKGSRGHLFLFEREGLKIIRNRCVPVGGQVPSDRQNRVGDKVSGHNISNELLLQVQRPQQAERTGRQDSIQSVNVVRPPRKRIFVCANHCNVTIVIN